MEYLETVTSGSFQLNQAPGYIKEHTSEDGNYQIWVNQHSDNLMKGQIQPQCTSKTKSNVRIEYDKTYVSDPIKDFCCICLARHVRTYCHCPLLS